MPSIFFHYDKLHLNNEGTRRLLSNNHITVMKYTPRSYKPKLSHGPYINCNNSRPPSNSQNRSTKFCHICCISRHTTQECWFNGRKTPRRDCNPWLEVTGRVKKTSKSKEENRPVTMYISSRYAFLYTESCIDDPEQVVSSPCVVSSVDQLACDAPATDDTSNFNDTAEVDSSSIDNLPTSESIETVEHTDFAFSSKGLHVSNLNVRHIVPKIDEIGILLSSENSPHIIGLYETFLRANNLDS